MAAANRCSSRGALTFLLLGAVCVIAMMVPTASASVIDESTDADHGRSLKTIGLLSKLFHYKVAAVRTIIHKPVYHHRAVVVPSYGKKGRKLQGIGLLGKLFHYKVAAVRTIIHKPIHHHRAVVIPYSTKKGRKMMAFE